MSDPGQIAFTLQNFRQKSSGHKLTDVRDELRA